MGSETAVLEGRDDDFVGGESVQEVRDVGLESRDGVPEVRYPD